MAFVIIQGIMMEPSENRSPVQPIVKEFKIFIFALTVVMGSLNMGYFLVLISIIEKPIANFNGIQANNEQTSEKISLYLSLATSAFPLGGTIGSILYKKVLQFSVISGQNKMMRITDYGLIVLCLINMFSLQIEILILLRFLMGLLMGLSGTVVPTYLISIAPTSLSGRIGSLNQIFITIGIAIAYAMGFLLSEGQAHYFTQDLVWKLIVALPIVFCLIRIVGISYFGFDCIQTHIKKGENKELKRYIQMFYKERTFNLSDLIASKAAMDKKQQRFLETNCENLEIIEKPIHSSGWRKRIFLAIVLCIVNQFCGINAIIFYANQLFDQISGGNHSYAVLMSFYLGIFQIIVTIFSGSMMDKYGRRFLMIIGASLIMSSLLFGYFILDFTTSIDHKYATYAIFAHIAGFSLSLGPITVLYITQIIQDISPFMIMLWVETILISITSNIMIEKIGIGKVFLIYGMITAASIVYIWLQMKESKGKTRQQLQQLYQQAVSVQRTQYQKLNIIENQIQVNE